MQYFDFFFILVERAPLLAGFINHYVYFFIKIKNFCVHKCRYSLGEECFVISKKTDAANIFFFKLKTIKLMKKQKKIKQVQPISN